MTAPPLAPRTSSGAALADAQRTMLTLLAQPLLTAGAHPRQFQLVLAQQKLVSAWASRLGYRLAIVGQAVRLHRLPLAGTVAVPPPPAPVDRRELVLTMLAAMAAEECEGVATTQMLSDTLRVLCTTLAVPAYQPDLTAERRCLLRALARLEAVGVLRRRSVDDSALTAWEGGTGAGAGYEIVRDAQLSLVDPQVVGLVLPRRRGIPGDVVELTADTTSDDQATPADADIPPADTTGDTDDKPEEALEDEPGTVRAGVDGFATPPPRQPAEPVRDPTTWQRLLRALIETPALVFSALSDADAAYARAQAGRLSAAAVEMTGGVVETRAEGMLLVLDDSSPSGCFVDWPRPSQPHQISLRLLDALLAHPDATTDEHGCLHAGSELVEQQATALFHALHGG